MCTAGYTVQVSATSLGTAVSVGKVEYGVPLSVVLNFNRVSGTNVVQETPILSSIGLLAQILALVAGCATLFGGVLRVVDICRHRFPPCERCCENYGGKYLDAPHHEDDVELATQPNVFARPTIALTSPTPHSSTAAATASAAAGAAVVPPSSRTSPGLGAAAAPSTTGKKDPFSSSPRNF